MFRSISNFFSKKAFTDKNFEYLFDNYYCDEFVCFDCETTGLNPKIDDIISIGAVKIKKNKILTSQKFERLAKPVKKQLDEESIKIHRIRSCDLENAEEIQKVIYDFLDFVGNRPLVGYYLEFDVAMINKYTTMKTK